VSISVQLREKLGQMYSALRWRGPRRVAIMAVQRVLRPLVEWQVFKVLENDVAKEAQRGGADGGAFPVKIFRLEDGPEQVAAELAPILRLEPVDVGGRLLEGDVVGVGYSGNQAVGCCWAAFRRKVPLPMDTVWHINPGEAVLYHSFVLPEWRGKRVHRSLDVAFNAFMLEHGIRCTLASMSTLNPQTLSLAKRHDKPFVLTLYLVRITWLRWTWRYATGRPFHKHFEAAPKKTKPHI
jgi:hypothetical protein